MRVFPLLLMIALALAGAVAMQGWVQMVAITAALFWLAKGLVLLRPEGAGAWSAPGSRWWAWLLAWPGMDPRGFFDRRRPPPALRAGELLEALLKMGVGAGLVLWAARHVETSAPWLTGAVALFGLALLVLHGVLHLASVLLRRAGIHAPPIFHWPPLAKSLSDFWGLRWNRAFREMARLLIVRPLRGRVRTRTALAFVFLISGLAHELIVSLPARGGVGGPTLYFAVQGLGLWLERSRWGGVLRSGLGGRLFAWACVVGPLPLLFHAPFVHHVVQPFLRDIDAWI